MHQREILWLPLSFVEPDGPPTVEAVSGGDVVTVYSVRGGRAGGMVTAQSVEGRLWCGNEDRGRGGGG